MRICRIATVPFFLRHHLGEQIAATARAGHEVVLVSSPGAEAAALRSMSGVRHYAIPIPRQISIFRDLFALLRLLAFFRRRRFDLIHSTTPKAGLLAAVAGRLAGVPVRLHTFTGQAWAERGGWVRRVAKACDRLIVRLNTRCYADSMSQRDFLVAQGIATADRIVVLGQGSLAGVDLTRFNRRCRANAAAIKERLNIPAGSPVVGFVGRVTQDKGIRELVAAFDLLQQLGCRDAHLILVGPLEPEHDPLPDDLVVRLGNDSRIHILGYAAAPEEYVAAFDVFCLPSYREGFGNVVLEAAAMGIPTVGTRIVGLADAVVDGVTGILVPPKNVDELAAALARLLRDDALRLRMGAEAESRTTAAFDARQVNAEVLADYARLNAGGPRPIDASTYRVPDVLMTNVAAIVVAYRPDPATLFPLVRALLRQASFVVIADNGSQGIVTGLMADLASPRLRHIDLGRNLGVAAALNRGADLAMELGATHLLLSDQDSLPQDGMVDELLRVERALLADSNAVAAVGPQLLADGSGRLPSFVRYAGWRPRACLSPDADLPVAARRCDFLITSGTLLRREVFASVGGFAENLFIDNVDIEWCYRAASMGYRCYGAIAARMRHALGDRSVPFPFFPRRTLIIHNPQRLYFMTRNRWLLYRLPHVPPAWKIADFPRMVLKVALFSLLVPPRLRYLRAALAGILDGARGRSGSPRASY